MRERAWGTLARDLEHLGHPLLSTLAHELPLLPLKSRKALILACRSQSLPLSGTSFGDQILSGGIPPSIWDILQQHPYLESPIFSNLILDMVMAAPMKPQEVDQVLADMVAKEMQVMETTPLPSVLNYNVFFDPDCQLDSIHPTIPPNPAMASLVHNRLCQWKHLVSQHRSFPRMSSKTVSRQTARMVATYYNPDWTDEDDSWAGVTQETLEYIYHISGTKIQGPCEMRQKWYFANATPRTYYAGGGEAYFKSRFLQGPFNQLVDMLSPTERYSRVNPSRLRLSDDHSTFIIYDLSSFTSNCHEQRRFLDQLAYFCMDTEIEVYDGYHGPHRQNLGEMILEYNTMNHAPAYTMERIWPDFDDVLYHHTAGFLGVFGNIATCTFLHGAVVLQICESEEETNVAGDDGLIPGKSRKDALGVPRLLGVLAEEKCGTADESGAVHLKRPIKQVGKRLIPGRMLIWPHLELIYYQPLAVDPRYPYMNRFTPDQIRDSVASSITRFLYHLHTFESITPEERQFVLSFMERTYRRHKLPLRGNVPQCGVDVDMGFVPELSESSIGHDPIPYTIRSVYRGFATLPVSYQGIEDEIETYTGAQFRHRYSPVLSYLYKLGYVDRELPTEIVVGEEGLDACLEEYARRRTHLYTWRCLNDIPEHLLY